MEAHDEVEIIHVEDEPPEIFAELNQLGFSPHVRLRVLSSTPERVEVDLRDERVELGAIVAANVTVRKLEAGEEVPTGTATLADHSRQGEIVTVTGIFPSCQGPQRRRLLDLGVVPGTEITAELVSTGGDPVAYRIRGALIALRRDQARWIEVVPSTDSSVRRSA
jgi:DtxR family Mn-dependent transcriptional regulator